MGDIEATWRLAAVVIVPGGLVVVGCLVAMAWRRWKGPDAWRWFEERDHDGDA